MQNLVGLTRRLKQVNKHFPKVLVWKDALKLRRLLPPKLVLALLNHTDLRWSEVMIPLGGAVTHEPRRQRLARTLRRLALPPACAPHGGGQHALRTPSHTLCLEYILHALDARRPVDQ